MQVIKPVSPLPEDYSKIINEVSSILDRKERSILAEKYLSDIFNFKYIPYLDLISYLMLGKENLSADIYLKLFLLDASIPRRDDADTRDWFDRLKSFADTYMLEHAIIESSTKLHFTNKSGDHENLWPGPGTSAADFYYWDVQDQKAIFVEFKHWGTDNILDAVTYYASKEKRHYTDRVIICTKSQNYYWVNYQTGKYSKITFKPGRELKKCNLLVW